ncbi:hypothetical protein T484DRAFT_1906937, partial [Baffinella frigidus]
MKLLLTESVWWLVPTRRGWADVGGGLAGNGLVGREMGEVLEGWGEDEDEGGLMQAMRAHEDSHWGGRGRSRRRCGPGLSRAGHG